MARMLRDTTDSEKVNVLSAHAEVMFYRLMMKADDYGYFHANTKLIRSNCYPLRTDTVRDADISRWMDELQKAGLIVVFISAEKSYLRIVNFGQRLRNKKRKFPQDPSDNFSSDLHPDGYVYLIGTDLQSPVKIGFSLNPWARVKELSIKEKKQLVLLMTFKGSMEKEKALHQILKDHRVNGEWFNLSDAVIQLFVQSYKNNVVADELIVVIRSNYVVQRSSPEEEEEEEEEEEVELEEEVEEEESLQTFLEEGLIYNVEDDLLRNTTRFEVICMAAGRTIDFAKSSLTKYHLFMKEKDNYPKKRSALYSGFQRWLMNEKDYSHASKSSKQVGRDFISDR